MNEWMLYWSMKRSKGSCGLLVVGICGEACNIASIVEIAVVVILSYRIRLNRH